MKRMICMTLTLAVGSVLAADVTYTEPPANTSMIKVAEGTTTVAGRELGGHLTHYWSFDDATDPYADSVGNIPLSAFKKDEPNDPVRKDGDEAKRGGALWTSQGLKAASNFIDGRHPFTICFWYKYGYLNNVSQESILHIGQVPKGNTQVGDKPYLRVSHHNKGNPIQIDLWNNQVTYAGSSFAGFKSNVWNHVALVCEVVEAAGCAPSNRFTVCLNGVATAVSRTVAQQAFAETDNFLVGMGYHYQGSEKQVDDATFDEVMCFDRALTSEELKTVAVCGMPPDFSAGWDIATDGTLDLQGREPLTALKGEGVAKTVETMRLEASSNAWFAGSVQSPAFTFAGETAVTQTLSGANAWTGATTVKSGTLEIAASPVEVFGDALVAWYPFEDATKPGRDFSPRGNHLTAQDGLVRECTESNVPFAGAGRVLSVKGNTEVKCLYSPGRLKGFEAGQDNSFTVSFWLRTDSVAYREGPFKFGTDPATGIRIEGATSLRIGDTGNMMIPPTRTYWGDEVWRHWVLAYDADAASRNEACYHFFIDGELVGSSPNHMDVNHADGRLSVGQSLAGQAKPLDGALDEFIVLNTCDTNDVAKLYALRRVQPAAGTGVLPTGTTVTVEEGATLKLTAVNETVAQLFGKGTIDLSGNSKLTVTTKDRFDGTVVGGEITDEPGAGRPGLMILVK